MLNNNYHKKAINVATTENMNIPGMETKENKMAVVFTAETIRTLRNLPDEDRRAVTDALVSEFILDCPAPASLTGLQNLMYYMIADGIRRATRRLA